MDLDTTLTTGREFEDSLKRRDRIPMRLISYLYMIPLPVRPD
jgi:hypothetical protein